MTSARVSGAGGAVCSEPSPAETQSITSTASWTCPFHSSDWASGNATWGAIWLVNARLFSVW